MSKTIKLTKDVSIVRADNSMSATMVNVRKNLSVKKRLNLYKEAMGMDYYYLKDI